MGTCFAEFGYTADSLDLMFTLSGTSGAAPAAVSSATLGCGYHAGTTSDGTSHLYTNATDANEASVVAGQSRASWSTAPCR
jgi:hypothetical protein